MDYDHASPIFGHEPQSAVSWAAIFAGAVAALALAVVLTSLAAGFGLRFATPWPGPRNVSADFTPILGAWMIVAQVLSAALGGYLAGRLRTKWLNVHGHEVHFRDTAHGLLAWALSTVLGAVLAATVLAQPIDPALAGEILDPANLQRQTDIAAQLSLFMGIGLLLSAFIASVAAALGGIRRDEMHRAFWEPLRKG
jgi:cytochrome bd-type quinol oxidase subunit 2